MWRGRAAVLRGHNGGAAGTAAAVVLFCIAASLTLFFIPPWQNPDEPQHYMKGWLYSTHTGTYSSAWIDPREEAHVIASMAESGWWLHYGAVTPRPLPQRFADGPALVVDGYFGPTPGGGDIYYRMVGWLFRTIPTGDAVRRMYVMRLLSLIAGVAAVLLIGVSASRFMGPRSGVVLAAMAALHPQVAIVSTTAGPDAWVNLAGVVVWWQGCRALRDAPHAAVWSTLAAVAATLVRRMAAPLIPLALTAGAVGMVRMGAPRRTLVVGVISVMAFAIAVWLVPGVRSEMAATLAWSRFDLAASVSTSLRRAADLPDFLGVLFRSFWLSAGWQRHEGPWWVYAIAFVGCVIAAPGAVRALRRPTERRVIAFSMLAVLYQLAAIVLFHFGAMQTGPQGRYLFPVLTPVLVLLWVGWRECLGSRREVVAALSIVAGMMALALVTWVQVIFPAYL